MSQTVITTAFEALKAQQAAANTPVVLDEFVFANVPGLNITDPIDPAEALPTAGQIVHRAAVAKTGMVNANAVVYSVTLGADVGDFDFNWVGLMDKTSNTLAMIVHAPVQQKVKNASGTQGNVLTRSFLMEYDGAKKQTEITTPAGTWQIDFTARLAAMDERHRLENIDVYGTGAFIGDGFLAKRAGNNYSVTAGVGYVGGLRAELAADQALTVVAKPVKIWVDTSFTGTLTSVWQVDSAITVANALTDYVKNDVKHYVFAVAQINADGSVTDLRKIGSNADDLLAKHIANLNAHSQYAFKNSPALTGKPTAPTPAQTENSTQLATTEFVHALVAALVASSPEQLDTLNELAAALGNDSNFAATMTAALAAKAPLASPVLTGLPTAPTAPQTANDTQIATTAFVKAVVAALIDSSPGALDTLNELAAALGNDANFAATMTNTLAGKQPLDNTLNNLSGKNVAQLLQYLDLDVALRNKQDANGTLNSLAFYTDSVSKLPYFDENGDYVLTGLTKTGRGLLSATTIADLLDYLTLGPIATSSDVTAGTAKKLIDAARLKAFLPKRSFAANDYIRIPDEPGGLIIQWVYSSPPGVTAETEIPVNLPIPFPNMNLGSMVSTLGVDVNSDIFFQVKSNELGLVRVLAQILTENPKMTPSRSFIISIGF